MREPADRERIERFFDELGRRVGRAARMVITGGASMVLRGLRGQTLDVDYSVGEADAAIGPEIEALKEKLRISAVFADPAHFGPLPAGREARQTFHGRYGRLDVLLDDPYAVAFSKLRRGEDRDLRDVAQLARAGFVDLDSLETKSREVAAPGTLGALQVDLAAVLDRLARVRRLGS